MKNEIPYTEMCHCGIARDWCAVHKDYGDEEKKERAMRTLKALAPKTVKRHAPIEKKTYAKI